MKISTKGRYSLRLMLDLAMYQGDGVVPLKDVAARQQISVKYLEQVVSLLNKSGMIVSVRGKEGGYRLTKRPDEYRIGDIFRASEGSIAPVACLEGDVNPCERQDFCITLSFWKGLQKVINDYVDGKTLQDLLDDYESMQGNQYVI